MSWNHEKFRFSSLFKSLGSCHHELFVDKNMKKKLTHILTFRVSKHDVYKKIVGSLEFCFFFDKLSMTNKSSRKWQQRSFKLIASHHFGQGQVLPLVPEKKILWNSQESQRTNLIESPLLWLFFSISFWDHFWHDFVYLLRPNFTHYLILWCKKHWSYFSLG